MYVGPGGPNFSHFCRNYVYLCRINTFDLDQFSEVSQKTLHFHKEEEYARLEAEEEARLVE